MKVLIYVDWLGVGIFLGMMLGVVVLGVCVILILVCVVGYMWCVI